MKLKQYIQQLKQYRTLYIWGAGSAGREILQFVRQELTPQSVCFVDNNPAVWHSEKYGCPVLCPQEIPGLIQQDASAKILIAARDNVQIAAQICSMGISAQQIDPDILGIVRNLYQCDAEGVFAADRQKIDQARALLQDARSVEIFDRILAYRRTGDSSFLDGLADSPEDQYFQKELFTPGEQEIFVDCGCYTGDTLKALLQRTNNAICRAYLFEPDRTALAQLKEYVSELNHPNIRIYPNGCWNSNCDLSFAESGSWSSKVDPSGENQIRGIRVDDVLDGQPVTFVKMDIEGSEREALEGMQQSIQKYHPVLAISIYHKLTDLYEIPLQIQKMDARYRLYIRCYAPNSDTEIVCYAI